MSSTRVLTGITTTGTPHLGNYVGAIRPAIAASRDPSVDAYLFLADYHALIKNQNPDEVAQSSREIAATWLALGLDPEKTYFYRQSDIPEITELSWVLTCSAAKGLMNRAHAYKAAVQANEESGEDPDFGITMGLFSYPILMAADILIFNAHIRCRWVAIKFSMLRWREILRSALTITTARHSPCPRRWWMTMSRSCRVWMDAR